MGYATTRSLERVAAAMGELESAPIQFEPAQDVPNGGVLWALPALLATGLLRFTHEFYALPKGFYGIDSIFLLRALMALARISSIEQLRYAAPGEWGNLLGLDRVPEVRTLRAKTGSAVSGGGAGAAVAHGSGPGVDRGPSPQRTGLLCRRSRARLSRRPEPAAPALRGAGAVVYAGHHRLLDPRHGRSALLLYQ